MNDYFLRILARQRNEEILAEFRAIQLSRLERHPKTGSMKEIIRMFQSFLKQWKKHSVSHNFNFKGE